MTFHVLIRPQTDGEGLWWVAQCLEYDLAAQAETLEALEAEFGRILVGRLVVAARLGIDPFESLPQAPEECWKLWTAARRLETKDLQSFRTPDNDGPRWMIPPSWEARVA